MTKRFVVLATTSSLVFFAMPAMAQDGWADDRYADVTESIQVGEQIEDNWRDEARAGADYYSDPVIQTTYDEPEYDYEYADDRQADYGRSDHGYETYDDRGRGHQPRHTGRQHPQAARFAYTGAQREEWLGQCRALRSRYDETGYYDDDDNGGNGGILGGLLGAVAGGILGNRVADGDRLLGTVIGGGLGGLAGAVIGSVIDGDGDDDDDRRAYDQDYGFDYCEAYLLNYERGYGTPAQTTYAPVAMVPVAQQPMYQQPQQRRHVRRVVEEYEIAEPAPRQTHRRRVRRVVAAPQQGKLQPIR